MKTSEVRKLLMGGFDELAASRGYSRRRKADLFEKTGAGWHLSVDLGPSVTYGRVKANLLFRVRIEPFEARLAEVIGSDLHERLGSTTFREDAGSLIPENILLALDDGVADIPPVLQLIERAMGDVEALAERASQDSAVLCGAGGTNLLRQAFACWEAGDRVAAATRLEELSSGCPPQVSEAAAVLRARLTTDEGVGGS